MRIFLLSATLGIAVIYTVILWFFPHIMLNPGELVSAHAQLDHNCFSCHTAFQGTPMEKCVACHTVQQIGLKTIKDSSKTAALTKIRFHAQLADLNCVACHNDHQGRISEKVKFKHTLLDKQTQALCNSCHENPKNTFHKGRTMTCEGCHNTNAWKPAHFDHDRLSAEEKSNCSSCHNRLQDKLHQGLTDNCGSCHSPNAWKPATFDHDKYFRLDADHRSECKTCHTQTEYKTYTCYGCHEHSPSKIDHEHVKEGIRDFANCVRCHKSGNKHDIEGGQGRSNQGEQENKKDRKKHDKHDDDKDDD